MCHSTYENYCRYGWVPTSGYIIFTLRWSTIVKGRATKEKEHFLKLEKKLNKMWPRANKKKNLFAASLGHPEMLLHKMVYNTITLCASTTDLQYVCINVYVDQWLALSKSLYPKRIQYYSIIFDCIPKSYGPRVRTTWTTTSSGTPATTAGTRDRTEWMNEWMNHSLINTPIH